MPDIWCLEVDKIILDNKNLVKTEIFLQQCSLALVGTINWTSQMLSIWLLLCLNLYFDWWKQDCGQKAG